MFLNVNIYNFQDFDSIVFELPQNLNIEYLPQQTKFSSKFGEYQSWLSFENHTLTYNRRIRLSGGLFQSSDYKEWIEFVKKVKKNDRIKVVFTDKKIEISK